MTLIFLNFSRRHFRRPFGAMPVNASLHVPQARVWNWEFYERASVRAAAIHRALCMNQLLFSDKYFNLLARLVLGEMPVQRVNGMYLYRTSVRNFGQLCFGKCTCWHCFLPGDALVFDSEWHWLFDCTQFSLSTSLATSLQASRKRADIFQHLS